MKNNRAASSLRFALPLAVIASLALGFFFLRRGSGENSLVVYCAHDSVYSEKILKEFERRTGIHVDIRFDTEATKSLGLTELIIREKDAPRCDVFWNNELLGTMDLKERGLLHPYKGAGYERIPADFRDDDGHWVGFAARMRVYIISQHLIDTKIQHLPNNGSMGSGGTLAIWKDRDSFLESVVKEKLAGDLSRVAIAKPLFGTTLTHYSALWKFWDDQRLKKYLEEHPVTTNPGPILKQLDGSPLKAWHNDCRKRGIREVAGNAMVKNLVAEGVCDLGFTDTDDFFEAKDEGKPVEMLPVRLDNGAVICIPNTVAIIKGTKHLTAAQKLVDFLLSEENELTLANAKSRQIPLGKVDESKLSDEVRQLKQWSANAYPLTGLSLARASCIAWLKSEDSK